MPTFCDRQSQRLSSASNLTRGGECGGGTFKQIYEGSGIRQELATPETPQLTAAHLIHQRCLLHCVNQGRLVAPRLGVFPKRRDPTLVYRYNIRDRSLADICDSAKSLVVECVRSDGGGEFSCVRHIQKMRGKRHPAITRDAREPPAERYRGERNGDQNWRSVRLPGQWPTWYCCIVCSLLRCLLLCCGTCMPAGITMIPVPV